MRHASVALFVPHVGCKNACSFCDQRAITGAAAPPSPDDVARAADRALGTLGDAASDAEIAFFGGSFTAINPAYRTSLLKAAYLYVEKGLFRGIRISTRPDAISWDILQELRRYGVTTVELGAQSMRDEVLAANLRGHTAQQVRHAAGEIKAAGFSLGLQMMTGLYLDDDAGAAYTAEEIIKLSPDCVRIYPTVLFVGTTLETLFEKGMYRPQTLDEAAALCAGLLLRFHRANIPVIRLGLHAIEKKGYIAGPFHPAFREICEGKIYYERALSLLEDRNISEGDVTLAVRRGEISKIIGQRRINIEKLSLKGYNCRISVDACIEKYEVELR